MDEASDALAADDGNEPLTGRYRDSRREVTIRNQLRLTGTMGIIAMEPTLRAYMVSYPGDLDLGAAVGAFD